MPAKESRAQQRFFGEKSIYFNHHFPECIQDFAVLLDKKANWTDVPAGEERKHEKAIWESIREPNPAK